MSWHQVVLLICLVACSACLCLTYAIAGPVAVVGIGTLSSLVWFLAYKRPSACPPSASLVVSIGLAAIGAIIHAPSFLTLTAAALALASWDLVRMEHILDGKPAPSAGTIEWVAKAHYSSLAGVLSLGLLIPLAGGASHLQIPFVAILSLVILALFGLDRVWRGLTTLTPE